MSVPLSLLDLAFIGLGETAADALHGCVQLARRAEACGYRRVWYAEHHNMSRIASSAPAVLIAHVAAHTRTIRLGAGGVMLPNHAPLVIAEQFGTLASLHPGRIDLGLGRAPGGDASTFRALRREATAADTFPQDVAELQAYLGGHAGVAGVLATPGSDTKVPLYILGSSLYGARLAANLGLPYAFASHFAPAALQQAVALYRGSFRPSAVLARPYVIAGINVAVADTEGEARAQLLRAQRLRVSVLLGGGRDLPDEEADAVLASPQGRFLREMMHFVAVGEPAAVRADLERFAALADADELMLALGGTTVAERVHAAGLVAAAWGPPSDVGPG